MRALLTCSLLILAACDGDPPGNGNGNGNGHTDDPVDCAPEDEQLFWRDADGDGWGVGNESIRACEAPQGYADQAGDCNDGDPTINPGAPDDQCNGIDNNCDGTPDSETEQVDRFRDADGDGWGVDAETSVGCLPREGWADRPGDCDDDDPAVHPGATELCDGKDTNCNGIENDGLWGSGALCPAESCREVRELLPSSASGNYWLQDAQGSYQAECRMDGTGGWTRITGRLLRERDWVGFRAIGDAAADDWVGRWDGDVIELVPRRRAEVTDCTTVVVRSRAELPFSFTSWEGSFRGSGLVNDTDVSDLGEPYTGGVPPCRGAVVFVHPETRIKRGGEWGFRFESSAIVSWAAQVSAFPVHTITWEINDFNNDSTHRANLRVDQIDIWVH